MSVAFPTRKPERDGMRDWIRAKMREGLDTADIAKLWRCPEADIWNRLAKTDHIDEDAA